MLLAAPLKFILRSKGWPRNIRVCCAFKAYICILIFVYYIIIAGETTSKIYAVKKGNQLYAQLEYS